MQSKVNKVVVFIHIIISDYDEQSNSCKYLKAVKGILNLMAKMPLEGYSRVRNKHTPTFINFWIFFQGPGLITDLKDLNFTT